MGRKRPRIRGPLALLEGIGDIGATLRDHARDDQGRDAEREQPVVKRRRRTETGEAPRRGTPARVRRTLPEARRPQPGPPPCWVLCTVGWQYREYLREEQRRQRGCIARRMQPEFYHGLLEPRGSSCAPPVYQIRDEMVELAGRQYRRV